MADEDEIPWFKSPVVLSMLAMLTIAGSSIGVFNYVGSIKDGYTEEVKQQTAENIESIEVAEQAARGAAAYEKLQSVLHKIEDAYGFFLCWPSHDGCEGLPKELPLDRKQNEAIDKLQREVAVNRKWREDHCQAHLIEDAKSSDEEIIDCTEYQVGRGLAR